jgi:hypothetical protein
MVHVCCGERTVVDRGMPWGTGKESVGGKSKPAVVGETRGGQEIRVMLGARG